MADFYFEVESMECMVKRLRGCGSGAQADAVVKSIKLINKAAGGLDSANAAIALYHLSVALMGKSHAAGALARSAEIANSTI